MLSAITPAVRKPIKTIESLEFPETSVRELNRQVRELIRPVEFSHTSVRELNRPDEFPHGGVRELNRPDEFPHGWCEGIQQP